MAASTPYETLQAIREEAGHHHLKNRESPTGAINGVNATYFVANVYLADKNYDDAVTLADVIAYVNDVPVVVSSIDASTGQVTLAAAPAGGATVQISYAFTRLLPTAVEGVRNEAQGWIHRRVKGYVDILDLDTDTQAVFKTITRLYAAGLLLIRDYGSSADSDLTSKDGYKKMKQAMDMLNEFMSDVTDDEDALSPVNVSSANDGNIYRRSTDLDNDIDNISTDDEFLRHND